MTRLERDNKTRRDRYKKDPEKYLAYNTANRYNISREYAVELRAKISNSTCDLCDSPEVKGYKNDFCIDHDHKTGEVRGVLCRSCNLALGYFKDDVKLLNNAIKYLNK